MLKVYLAGPILGCSDADAGDWRAAMRERLSALGHVVLDPMRRDYRGKELDHAAEIVELDKLDIANCDVMLVNYTRPSAGTAMEIFIAWNKCRRVITVVPEGMNPGPWVTYHSHEIVRTLDEAVAMIEVK